MRLFLLASAGGAVGAGLRYLVNVGFAAWFGTKFPWWTLFANITGCLAMGLLAGLVIGREVESAELRTFVATGILGGYTTFSAFSLDFATLLERGETVAALSYAAASVLFSLAAVFVGLWLVRGVP